MIIMPLSENPKRHPIGSVIACVLALATAVLAGLSQSNLISKEAADTCAWMAAVFGLLAASGGLADSFLQRKKVESFANNLKQALVDANTQVDLRAIVSAELQKERELVQSYLEMANVVMAVVGPSGEVEMMNKKGLDVLGLSERDALGESFVDLCIFESDQAWVKNAFDQAWMGLHLMAQMECRVSAKEKVLTVRWSNSVLQDEEGKPKALLLCGEDVTEQRAQEDQLKLMRLMVESIEEGLIALDDAGRVLWANPATERITGFSYTELKNRPLALFYPSKDGVKQLNKAFGALEGTGGWKGEVAARRKEGDTYPQSLSLTPLKEGKKAISRSVAVFRDISKEKEQEANIRYLANNDPLTGLPNRAAFLNALESALHSAKRLEHRVSTLFIDLDHFKAINDTLGHAAGDALLIEVAKRIKKTLRSNDFVARLGGDEFTVIFENIRSDAEAAVLAKRLLKTLSEPYEAAADSGIQVTPSIGIGMYPEDAEDASTLMKRSDLAMYEAKKTGRAAVCFFRQTATYKALNDQDTMTHRKMEQKKLLAEGVSKPCEEQ